MENKRKWHFYNTKVRKMPIWYKNIFIHHASYNSTSIKYYAYTSDGLFRSDTLKGIKSLINSII